MTVPRPPGPSGLPPPASPPAGHPQSVAPRPSRRPLVLGAVAGAALTLGGFGIGFLLFGGADDAEPASAAVAEPEADGDDPAEDDEFDRGRFDQADADDLEFPEGLDELLPDGFDSLQDLLRQQLAADVQVALAFTPGAPEGRTQPVVRAWQAHPALSGVYHLDTDRLEDLGGQDLPAVVPDSISAFGDRADAGRIRTFVCGFADAPGVQFVEIVGTRPCDQGA
jgi:hypothetical protein